MGLTATSIPRARQSLESTYCRLVQNRDHIRRSGGNPGKLALDQHHQLRRCNFGGGGNREKHCQRRLVLLRFEFAQKRAVDPRLQRQFFLTDTKITAQAPKNGSKRAEQGVIASSCHRLTVRHAERIVHCKYAPVYTNMTKDEAPKHPASTGESTQFSARTSDVLAGPAWQTPTPDPKFEERNALLEANNSAEIHTLASRQRGSRYYTSAFLPSGDGFLIVDLDWTENGFSRLQSLICPATVQAIDAMHSIESNIVALTFIEPPDHSGRQRAAPLVIDGIAVGVDSKRECRQELVLRTPDGKWHSSRRSIPIGEIAELEMMIDLKKSNAMAEYLENRKNSKATRRPM